MDNCWDRAITKEFLVTVYCDVCNNVINLHVLDQGNFGSVCFISFDLGAVRCFASEFAKFIEDFEGFDVGYSRIDARSYKKSITLGKFLEELLLRFQNPKECQGIKCSLNEDKQISFLGVGEYISFSGVKCISQPIVLLGKMLVERLNKIILGEEVDDSVDNFMEEYYTRCDFKTKTLLVSTKEGESFVGEVPSFDDSGVEEVSKPKFPSL